MTLSLLAFHTSITLQYRPLSCFYVLISELLLMKWRKHAENEKLQERRTWAELCELRNRTKVNAIEYVCAQHLLYNNLYGVHNYSTVYI